MSNIFFIYGIVIALIQPIYSECTQEAITNATGTDGFGSQFQDIISAAIYAHENKKKFVYTKLEEMDHNYNGARNDPIFLARMEWLINFEDNFEINKNSAIKPITNNYRKFFDAHVVQYANSVALQEIRRIFRANKDIGGYFNNEYLNIALHIRRPNPHDTRPEGTNTPNALFLAIINRLRLLFASRNPMFHVYSQGPSKNFQKFIAPDIALHLNESIEDTFIPMVLADVLVVGTSAFSHTAGILSEGIVYYIPFVHAPLPHWISVNTLLK